MKPKYSIGETVKIKATGEKVKIESVNTTSNVRGTLYTVKEHYFSFFESELKPYRPSRTGKYRNEKGQFIGMGQKVHEVSMNFINRKLRERAIKELSDSKQRNYQKILTKLDAIEKKIDELGRKV